MNQLNVYYGESTCPFKLPAGWTLAQNVVPEVRKPAMDVPALTERALAAPVSGPRLSELAGPETRVTVLVDDWTRSTPVNDMLPAVLQELQVGGVRSDQIDVIVALGTHEPMPQAAVVERVGDAVYGKVRVSQHDCWADDLVPMGRLSLGPEIRINPIVARADVTVALGSVLPHHLTGFGGGPKIVFPGVVNYDAVKAHHLHFTMHPNCFTGRLEGNPAYEENCRIAEMAGLTFLVNCVYNAKNEVADVAAGTFRAAHREAARRSVVNYGFHLNEAADVTITSAYPYNEAVQIVKPIVPSALVATKPGGAVIVAAASRDQFSEAMLQALDQIYAGTWDPHAPGFFSPALIYVPACAERNTVVIVSRDLKPETIQRLGYQHATTLEEAMEREWAKRPRATVNVFPIGGLVLPLTD